jgi:hypothetical protein
MLSSLKRRFSGLKKRKSFFPRPFAIFLKKLWSAERCSSLLLLAG